MRVSPLEIFLFLKRQPKSLTLCDSRKEYEFVRNLLVKEMKLKSGVRRGFVKELKRIK